MLRSRGNKAATGDFLYLEATFNKVKMITFTLKCLIYHDSHLASCMPIRNMAREFVQYEAFCMFYFN